MKESHTIEEKKHWKRQWRISRTRRRPISRSRERAAWIFLIPSLAGTGIFTALPCLDVVRRSFSEAYSGQFAGLANYRIVLRNEAFLLAVRNTLRFLLVCIPLLVVFSLILALAITGTGEKKKMFQAVFLIPMAIPIASVVLFWRLAFDMNGDNAFSILIFSYLWKNMGYFIVLWMAGRGAIPAAYYDAAKVDGASRWECFRYITLPGLAPSFVIVIVLAFVNSFKVFREAYLIAGDYPHKSIYMLQHLFNNWFVSLDIQKMSAAAVLLAFVTALVIAGVLRLEKRIGSED